MSALQSLETKLNEVLVTNAPVQLPDAWRKWLGTYAWVFALIGCIFGGFAALVLLPLLGVSSVVATSVGVRSDVLLFVWLSFFVLVAYVVLEAMAVPKLKKMQKAGWNFMFYSSLFFFVYDVFNALRNFQAGTVVTLFFNALFTLIGLYFVFQVRSQFMGKKTVEAPKA